MIINKYSDDIFGIDNKREKQINHILENYFSKVNEMISNSANIEAQDIASILIAIAENYDHFTDKKLWDTNINLIMLKVKELIEKRYYKYNLGIIGGLAEIDLATDFISIKSGNYKNFSKEIHHYFLHRTRLYISYTMSNLENVTIKHYDLIFGLTGIGESILQRNNKSEDDIEIIKDIITYINTLAWKITDENGESLPRFYVKSKNQMREDEKKDFPNGNINFGLAHGMIGPMIFLAKAMKMGIEIHNQLKTIYRIYDLYVSFMDEEQGVSYWPTQLSIENFLNKEKRDVYRIRRASWCYGTAGISRGLFIVGDYINDENIRNVGRKSLKALSKKEIEGYLLNSPIVCHGVAGLLDILAMTYIDEKCQCYANKVNELLGVLLKTYQEDTQYGFISVDEKINENGEVEIIKADSISLLEGSTGIILVLMSLYNGTSIFQNQILIE